MAHKIAKHSKPFSDGEFVKDCMVETADILCPGSKSQFEKMSLSRRTITRRVEVIPRAKRTKRLRSNSPN